MKFSYNWLKEYIPSLPPPKKLAEILTLHSFEVEAIEKFGKDWVFCIDVLPNRFADASSHRGMAREIVALFAKKIGAKKLSLKEGPSKIDDFLEIKVLEKDFCPRYSGRVIRGVKVAPSPRWLKERLSAVGFQSINNLVDAANYVMLDMGQPLHVFDFDKLAGTKQKTIFVRNAKKGEEFISLENAKYKLSGDDFVIADSDGPIALAGIKGARRPEVLNETKNIVIEAANFSGSEVRKTARSLNLMTDAATRFISGIDPNLTIEALEEASSLIQKLSGGEILKGSKDVYFKPEVPRKVRLRPEKARKLLGAEITDKEMIDILKRLSFEVEIIKFPTPHFLVTVPTRRRDIIIEEDLIEEIGRIHGYYKIKPTHPIGELVLPAINEKIFWEDKIRDSLKESGYAELYNYSFVGENELNALENRETGRVIEIQNPTRPEFAFLRPHLALKLLESTAKGLRVHEEIRFFELGKVYRFPEFGKIKDTSDLEEERLAVVIGSNRQNEPFFELKGVITSLFESLGVSDVWFDNVPCSPQEFHSGARQLMNPLRSAQIKAGDVLLGSVGELHPQFLKTFDIKGGAAFLEINLDELISFAEEEKDFRPVSRYPSLIRDIAILAPIATKVDEVLDVIENSAGELLADADLFDIYEGENIPEGKKNLAFHLEFRAFERTLADREAGGIIDKIISALEEHEGWEVRKQKLELRK